MKKLMILLSLLPACLVPGRAQQAQGFTTGAEYREYVETLIRRRDEMERMRLEDAERRSQRYEQAKQAAEAETDPEKRKLLEDRAQMEYRMIGEVASSYFRELDTIDRELESLEAQYGLVFEEAFPYYRDREKYSKQELKDFLKQASREIRRSPTGKALKKYIRALP
jgi:hypothetical protein